MGGGGGGSQILQNLFLFVSGDRAALFLVRPCYVIISQSYHIAYIHCVNYKQQILSYHSIVIKQTCEVIVRHYIYNWRPICNTNLWAWTFLSWLTILNIIIKCALQRNGDDMSDWSCWWCFNGTPNGVYGTQCVCGRGGGGGGRTELLHTGIFVYC